MTLSGSFKNDCQCLSILQYILDIPVAIGCFSGRKIRFNSEFPSVDDCAGHCNTPYLVVMV